MFTGIIKEIGLVRNFGKLGNVHRLDIGSDSIYKTAGTGDSVAVSGVCLTLTVKASGVLSFDVMEETLARSTLGVLRVGDRVNLEEAVRAGDSFGGHFVTGHVDCIGRIKEIKTGDGFAIAVEISRDWTRLVVEKGSVSLDGISLTVGEIRDNEFNVYVIPHTLKATTLGSKRAGDQLNIEFDIIGKTCARLFDRDRSASRISEEFLKNKGFD